ncbi:MAG: MFS transporter [Alphaproteobacteria bacterium]|nr:MFS transporter [Alphaproteobacteria bacterium]
MSSQIPQILRPIAPVLLSLTLIEFGVAALNPLIGYQLTLREVPTQIIGIIASCYFAGFVTGSLTAARAVDRVGHIRAITTFAIIMAGGVLLLALTSSSVLWAAIRFCMGYGMAGMFICVESWLSHKSTLETRGRIFSAYLTVAQAGGIVGPLALALFDPSGTTLFLVVALFYASSIIPMALTEVGNPEIGDRVRFGIVRLFQISPLGVIVAGASAFASTAFNQLVPVYINDNGLTPGHLASLLMIAKIGAVSSQVPVGYLSDRLGRRPMIVACAALAATGAAGAFMWGGQSFFVLAGSVALMVGASSPLYGLAVAHTNDHCQRSEYVAAAGGSMLAWSIGATIGPTVAAGVMNGIGATGLFVYSASAYGAIALYALYRSLRRAAPQRAPHDPTMMPGKSP